MYKRMLVLLDGSKQAEVIFSYARELAARLSLHLDLLNVCKQSEKLPMCQAYIERMTKTIREQSEQMYKKAELKTHYKAIEVKGATVVGFPADEILKYADENKIDIIMLSSHGSSSIRRWSRGSVVDKVINQARVPVWLVPAQLREEIIFDKMSGRSVLIPLDGSKLAEAVIPYVEELIKQRDEKIEIFLVNVIKKSPIPTSISNEARGALIGDAFSSMKTTGETYLHGIALQLRAKGHKVQLAQLIGDTAKEIVSFASVSQPLVIALSTRSLTGFNRFVFDNVTENILRRIQKTPLFLVRPNE